jgi:hypothetical protein
VTLITQDLATATLVFDFALRAVAVTPPQLIRNNGYVRAAREDAEESLRHLGRFEALAPPADMPDDQVALYVNLAELRTEVVELRALYDNIRKELGELKALVLGHNQRLATIEVDAKADGAYLLEEVSDDAWLADDVYKEDEDPDDPLGSKDGD